MLNNLIASSDNMDNDKVSLIFRLNDGVRVRLVKFKSRGYASEAWRFY